MTWYSCLLYVSGFQKVNRLQISSEVDMERLLLGKYANMKRTTVSYGKVIWIYGFYWNLRKTNLIPKFLQFKLRNRHLHNSVVYRKCQIKLLEERIKAKRKRINVVEKDTKRIKEELQGTLSCLDFSYICSLFLIANDKSNLHLDNIQKRKLKNLLEVLLKEVINDSHDPNKVIFNFSSYELSDVEKEYIM